MANLFQTPAKSAKNLLWFPLYLFLYSFTGNVSNDIYMPSMPILVKVFDTSDHWIQMTLAMWFLGAAAPQLLMGPVADRYGRRKLLFVGGFIIRDFRVLVINTHPLCSTATAITNAVNHLAERLAQWGAQVSCDTHCLPDWRKLPGLLSHYLLD